MLGMFKEKLVVEELMNDLSKENIHAEMDEIPYGGLNDMRYRILVFGKDVVKGKDLASKYLK